MRLDGCALVFFVLVGVQRGGGVGWYSACGGHFVQLGVLEFVGVVVWWCGGCEEKVDKGASSSRSSSLALPRWGAAVLTWTRCGELRVCRNCESCSITERSLACVYVSSQA